MKLLLIIFMMIPLFVSSQVIKEVSSEELKELILKEKSISFFTPKFSNEHKKIGLKYLQQIEDSELGFATNLIVYLANHNAKALMKELQNMNRKSKKVNFTGSIYIISEQVDSKYYNELFDLDCKKDSFPMTIVNDQNKTSIYSGIDGSYEKYLLRIKIK